MRRTVTVLAALVSLGTLTATAHAQVSPPAPVRSAALDRALPAAGLFLVDGREIAADDVKRLAPESIENIEVLKGASAAAYYGERARLGVVIINTKNATHDGVEPDAPLYIINGLQVTTADGMQLARESIASVEVLKGAAVIQLYGTQARNGVIIITTKPTKP